MRVILEVSSGPDAGRKAPLRVGQRLQVGRTEQADFALPHDGRMSSLHFALGTDEAGCCLEDLGSTNGTLLNDQPVAAKTALRDGDRIRAGQTDFVVHVEGQFRQAEASAAPRPAGPGPAAAPRAAPPPPGTVTYTAQTSNSKLLTCRGKTGQIEPFQVAALLSKDYPLYLVVDFSKLDEPVPESLAEPEYLFNWFPEESRATFSQIILSGSDEVDLFSWIEKAWGKDALVCIFCRAEKAELLEHLRRTAGAYARPSILTPHLQLAAPEGARNLFAGIDAVFLEGDTPDQWVLISGDEFHVSLDKLGFSRVPTTET